MIELGELAHRVDAWENCVTGFNTTRDKTTYATFAYGAFIGDAELDALYHGDDMASTMVDVVPQECMRRGFELALDEDSEQGELVIEALRELDAFDKIVETDAWARLYGGATLVLGADDGQPANLPLRPERVRKVDWLQCVDKRYLTPFTFYTTGPKAGEPETYFLHRPGSYASPLQAALVIHESRMLVFRGARTSYLQRQARNYWDISVLQRPYEIMRSFSTVFKAVEILTTDGAQAVFKVKDLASLKGAKQTQYVQEKATQIDLSRSVARAILVDAETEGFERHNFTWAGLGDILDKFMLRLAASVRIPVTILMGQSPAGMNATGESDFRWFYDTIETRQHNYLESRVRKLVQILCASREGPTGGQVPKQIEVEWCKLWQPTPKEQAEQEKAQADTDAILIGADVLTPEEVALSPGLPKRYTIDREARELAQEAAKKAQQPPAQELVTPTDMSLVVTVNQVLASKGYPPHSDPAIGEMTVYERKAQIESEATQAAATDEPDMPEDEDEEKRDGAKLDV